ncbi:MULTISPECIES: hypothetical protein [unclassified Coleofasciculus]|uniref:hypothetical protein n=1 Tax=unclassified Coleofasciculus TaxID=2692782 RepID=UPI001880B420|nr:MULTISPECIES: hypothetical protein [unclassified Coleofasciculus]MBE9127874.1 hypothetical protein [Coleofasciculus sp. LEGE 07081]MBE9151066.1 hypothetical protein [Coleofasciculus sp. LEGE 07092]
MRRKRWVHLEDFDSLLYITVSTGMGGSSDRTRFAKRLLKGLPRMRAKKDKET